MADTHFTTPQTQLIAVQGLAKRFGARTAIEKLSINLQAGEIFGLIGANGGGKTTALRMLAGLIKADAGSGTVLGYDLLNDAVCIRERVGYMSQSFSMYPSLTVYENLQFRAAIFAVAKPRQAVEKMLETFSLGEFRHAAAGKLSGGWARLLQLAASLLHQPNLVLLDEPTAGLDAAHRHEVWRHIMNLARSGAAVVLSTHDLAEAERCAQLALLSQGVVRASGTAQQVIDQAVAIALRVTGDRALPLAETLSLIPGVIAAYPHGRGLHIVVEPTAVPGVQRIIDDHASQHTQVALSFEDAALTLSTREPRAARADAA